MTDKDINIHVKAKGVEQAKQDLGDLSKSTEKVGQTTQQAGNQAAAGTEKMTSGFGLVKGALSSLIGPLGIAAIGAAFVASGKKVIEFYDNLKAKNDEAVRQVQQLRGVYMDLFEATGAFSEAARKKTVLETTQLLAETRVPREIGLPIMNAYTRQFRDSMSGADYDAGLRGMLSYGARHGGEATVNLIEIMRGFGMTTSAQQGEFRRMVAEGSGGAGLEDAELINALGRGMPIIQAMKWTPEHAIANAVVIAQGETGRVKKSLPGTTFEAMSSPQLEAAKKYGIPEDIANDPGRLFEDVSSRSRGMDQQTAYRMIQDIYGAGAAPGVFKLINADRTAVNRTLQRARGAEGIAAEAEEDRLYRETLEARDAGAKAIVEQIAQDVTTDEQYREDIREVGREYQKVLDRRRPIRNAFRKLTIPGDQAEFDDAAMQKWIDSLSPEQRAAIQKQYMEQSYGVEPVALEMSWNDKTPQQQYNELVPGAAQNININNTYNQNVVYQHPAQAVRPRSGPDDLE